MPRKDLTTTLRDATAGDGGARDALAEAVYDELREMAERKLRRERSGHLLQPTALVHEAYIKLVDQTRVEWQGQAHFKALAAQAMQRILVDAARRRDRRKRGGKWRRVALDDAFALSRDRRIDLAAFQEALETMRTLDPRQARVVELRLLGGLSTEETATLLEISARTVERDWKMGRAWLRRELSTGDTV